MAFSLPLTDSVKTKGQTALLCQLCEENPKIKWKCLDCKLMMCQRCRDKIHPKFPSAEDHTIIDIKEMGKHQTDPESRPDMTKIKCGVHSGQNCCLFCKTCQELVCQTCVAKNHNKHDFSEINDEYHTKIETVKGMQKELKRQKQILTERELKLSQIQSYEQVNYDKVKQEILDYEKALISKIKKHTSKLLKELDRKLEVLSKSVNNEHKKIKEKQNQIEEQIQNMNDIIQSPNAKDVFSPSESLSEVGKINVTSAVDSFQGISKFIRGDQTQISLLFGNLEDISIQIYTELHESEFETDLKAIDSVVSCPDDSLWLCDSFSSIVQKVRLINGDKISVVSNIKKKVYDAALLTSGDLLLSVVGSSNLKLVPSGSTDIKNSVYTVSPLYPTGIHVTGDNKVIVGAVNTDEIPATGPRQFIVMDQTGYQEKVFQYDRHNKPLFTGPHRVTSNSQGNIAVVDIVTGDYRGRVVVLDQEVGVRNIYTGHPDVNNENNPFTPTGITTTPSYNFVVADTPNHTLHILNSEGEIITFYNTKEIGILLPLSISFSASGQLYIGCGYYKDSNEKSKLFKVNNFLY